MTVRKKRGIVAERRILAPGQVNKELEDYPRDEVPRLEKEKELDEWNDEEKLDKPFLCKKYSHICKFSSFARFPSVCKLDNITVFSPVTTM